MKKPKITFHITISWDYITWPFIQKQKLRWKDKHGSPSVEIVPYFSIYIWPISLLWVKGSYDYWEQYLWIAHWYKGDIRKAKRAWGWTDMDTKQSTWKDSYCKSISNIFEKL